MSLRLNVNVKLLILLDYKVVTMTTQQDPSNCFCNILFLIVYLISNLDIFFISGVPLEKEVLQCLRANFMHSKYYILCNICDWLSGIHSLLFTFDLLSKSKCMLAESNIPNYICQTQLYRYCWLFTQGQRSITYLVSKLGISFLSGHIALNYS